MENLTMLEAFAVDTAIVSKLECGRFHVVWFRARERVACAQFIGTYQQAMDTIAYDLRERGKYHKNEDPIQILWKE